LLVAPECARSQEVGGMVKKLEHLDREDLL